MNFILCFLGIFIFSELAFQSIQAYRYTMFDFDINNLCNSQYCSNKRKYYPHITCMTGPLRKCRAKGYSPIKVNHKAKLFMLMGINGIRNRVAGRLKIANMNILHWDRYLAQMAESSLYLCDEYANLCDFLYLDEYTVGQTWKWVNKPAIPEWYVFPIRSWYSEMNNRGPRHPKSIADLKRQFEIYDYFTQLIWPTSEFVGCAAARFTGAYIMSCFFHPRFNFTSFDQSFIEGFPCTKCSEDRSTCSRQFIKLCGLDLKLIEEDDSAASLIFNWSIILFWFLVLYITK